MGRIKVTGGRKLEGSLKIQGSKNAALPMIAAAALHDGITILHNCPQIQDVKQMIEILRCLGGKADWAGDTLRLDCTALREQEIPEEYAQKMRSSIIYLGVMLGRFGKGRVAHPGGCVIGKRPIDLHLTVLEKLGAVIKEEDGKIQASGKQLQGASFTFPISSVGATQQAILASVFAEGTTILSNCAREPEVQWLIRFLNQRGARITGGGTTTIGIQGVDHLRDVEFWVPSDRIVAGTYICAGAITRSKITLEEVCVEELGTFLELYGKMGGQYEVKSGTLILDSRNLGRPIPYVETGVYPGFPTDLQSPLMAVLATIPERSQIRETIFEDRFKAAAGLVQMGADISVDGRDAYIRGSRKLYGTRLEAQELRGGAALILAGLFAEGETIVDHCEYIERGYEHICEDLSTLGGVINKDTG